MALRGEPGAMIDACIHLATIGIDDPHMHFDIVIIISSYREQNMFSLSVQATVRLST